MGTKASSLSFDAVYVACGSGGTAGGLGLAMWLSRLPSLGGPEEEGRQQRDEERAVFARSGRLRAVGVCDSPEEFYSLIDRDILSPLVKDMVVVEDEKRHPTISELSSAVPPARHLIECIDATGLGYSRASARQLENLVTVARSTGVILDPVYSGKAVLTMIERERQEQMARGEREKNHSNEAGEKASSPRRVLFVHTGGLFGAMPFARRLLSAAGVRDKTKKGEMMMMMMTKKKRGEGEGEAQAESWGEEGEEGDYVELREFLQGERT